MIEKRTRPTSMSIGMYEWYANELVLVVPISPYLLINRPVGVVSNGLAHRGVRSRSCVERRSGSHRGQRAVGARTPRRRERGGLCLRAFRLCLARELLLERRRRRPYRTGRR